MKKLHFRCWVVFVSFNIICQACNLPMVPGPCEGSYFHYGYNSERGICEQFKYGGCLGKILTTRSSPSIVNFFIRKQQQVQDDRGVRWSLCWKWLQADADWQVRTAHRAWSLVIPVEPNLIAVFSAGNFTRYGFDKETETCEEFNYGGCKGYWYNFMYMLLDKALY